MSDFSGGQDNEGDGSIINWSKFNELLREITGDEYEGVWEIL